MLNNDFWILTLVDQQAQLVNQSIAPRYNYSATILPIIDTILPILGPSQVWMMNSTNTAIVATDFSGGGGGGSGTVTDINTGLGLTGGPITVSGTISFAAINANTFWGNITGVSALPTQVSTSYFLISSNNLSDVPNKATARINLGLQIGVNVEAWSASLDSLGAIVGGANEIPYFTAPSTYSVIAAAINSALVTNGAGVPAMSQTLPNAVQLNITRLGAQAIALNMNAHLIDNVSDPVNPQDAATKNYVDTFGGAFLPLAGGTMAGNINMNSNSIFNLINPSNPQDAATKAYVDTFLPLAGGIMSGIINMNSHKITNVTDPTNPQDAATKAYVDLEATNFLPIAGGTMTGQIDMGNNKITDMADPTLNKDAVNLEYLNTQLLNYLPLAGGTMAGAINMSSHKITNLLDPTNPQDAATKNYVDLVATGLNVQPSCVAASTGALTVTYSNGAAGIGATLTNAGAQTTFTLDSVNPTVGQRVLIWIQASTFQNGIYTVTNVGSGATNWILTRATDYDQPSEIQPGDLVIITSGTIYGTTSFIETDSVSVIGVDPIEFVQFTQNASAALLKAANLSDVANKTTSFNNISPLTTKGDLIAYSTQNIRLAVGVSDGQILQVNSAAATGLAWSTATYPATTTVNRILYSSSTNVVGQITSLAGGVLVTDNSSVPQFLTNPGAAGKVLQSGNSAIPSWSTPTYPSSSGTSGKFLISDGTNNVYSTSTIPTSAGAVAGKVLISDGTNYILSTATFPGTVGATGTILRSDGSNWVATTTTYPNTNAINTLLYASSANVMSALATANSGVLVTSSSGVPSILLAGTTGQVLQASTAGTPAWSTPTYPTASGATGAILISDGTNYIASTSLWPNTVGTSGKLLISNGTSNGYTTSTFPTSAGATAGKIIVSDGTNYVLSTPTFPNASATTRKIIVSDGTNWVASTETYAVPGTSGNVMTSDGTNWTSAAPAASGLAWSSISGTTQAAGILNGYVVSNAAQTTITLPATAALGSTVAIVGTGAAGWILTANTGQTIKFGNQTSTSAGSWTSTDAGDCCEVVCTVANLTWRIRHAVGNLTFS
jgi:hypothetical protein